MNSNPIVVVTYTSTCSKHKSILRISSGWSRTFWSLPLNLNWIWITSNAFSLLTSSAIWHTKVSVYTNKWSWHRGVKALTLSRTSAVCTCWWRPFVNSSLLWRLTKKSPIWVKYAFIYVFFFFAFDVRNFDGTISNWRRKDDVNYIRLLQLQISVTEDLRHLFILLVRNYNPAMQSRQYLQDLIVTNHILLLIPDGISQTPDPESHQNLMEHIQQYEHVHHFAMGNNVVKPNYFTLRFHRFATTEIMHQYGLLLENFTENGEYVNDCIFTMMHHIGGDLGQVNTLFQPIILKTYSQIWEMDHELCDVSSFDNGIHAARI